MSVRAYVHAHMYVRVNVHISACGYVIIQTLIQIIHTLIQLTHTLIQLTHTFIQLIRTLIQIRHTLIQSVSFIFFVPRTQVCSVTSPFFLSRATNCLYDGDLPMTMKYVALYAILAFAAKALKEAQSLVYLK